MAKGGLVWKEVDRWTKKAKRKSSVKQPSLKVGVFGSAAEAQHPNNPDATVGDIAFYNEFGTVSIPARSFIRDWVDGNIDNITRQLGGDLLKVFTTDKRIQDALTKRGRTYRAAIIKRIKERIPPPNAPSTLAQKSGDTPLIDTETLIDAIRYEVK